MNQSRATSRAINHPWEKAIKTQGFKVHCRENGFLLPWALVQLAAEQS